MNEQNGCFIPAAQAGVVGLLAGLVALAVGMWQGWSSPGWLALAVGALAGLLVFVSGVSVWRRSEFGQYYPTTYQAAQVDERRSVRVELHRPLDGGHQTQLADLPASYDQLKELAVGVLRGAPLSEVTWSGPGRPFTRAEFGALRAEFLRRGWCDWRRADSPGQGVQLTPQGKAVVRSFASETVTPLPRDGD